MTASSSSDTSTTSTKSCLRLATPNDYSSAFDPEILARWNQIATIAESVRPDLFNIYMGTLVKDKVITMSDALYLCQYYGYQGKAACLQVIRSGFKADFKPKPIQQLQRGNYRRGRGRGSFNSSPTQIKREPSGQILLSDVECVFSSVKWSETYGMMWQQNTDTTLS